MIPTPTRVVFVHEILFGFCSQTINTSILALFARSRHYFDSAANEVISEGILGGKKLKANFIRRLQHVDCSRMPFLLDNSQFSAK